MNVFINGSHQILLEARFRAKELTGIWSRTIGWLSSSGSLANSESIREPNSFIMAFVFEYGK